MTLALLKAATAAILLVYLASSALSADNSAANHRSAVIALAKGDYEVKPHYAAPAIAMRSRGIGSDFVASR